MGDTDRAPVVEVDNQFHPAVVFLGAGDDAAGVVAHMGLGVVGGVKLVGGGAADDLVTVGEAQAGH